MNDLGAQFQAGLGQAWTTLITFVPKLLLFLGILIIGYFLAKLLSRVVNALLERVGFDRLVERGGFKRMLQRTNWDASDILGAVVFYFLMLFILQIAFGVFGPNPVSNLLALFVAYIPNVFVALLIVVVAGAIATGVKHLTTAALGGMYYGKYLANGASVAVWAVGIFAALNQLGIAPAIVNGLFYALLAVFVGSAIIAVGGGGIAPMRAQWEKALGKVQTEGSRMQAEAAIAKAQRPDRGWQESQTTTPPAVPAEPAPTETQTPRFRT